MPATPTPGVSGGLGISRQQFVTYKHRSSESDCQLLEELCQEEPVRNANTSTKS